MSSDPGGLQRTVLFLQGPPSAFWHRLGDAFGEAGARVVRVDLCAADRLYWRRPGAIDYRGRIGDWPAFLEALIHREIITDILYYGDRNPYHVAAAEVARRLEVPTFAVEFGYLRPGWLTLERGGMGVFSHFPAEPRQVRRVAQLVPTPDLTPAPTHAFALEAFHEVFSNLVNVFLRFLYPNYVPDRFYPALPEYLSSVLRWWRAFRDRSEVRRVLEAVEQGRWPFCLFALQLQSDWQIRRNSPYPDQRDALDIAMASLVKDAPEEMRLVVKLHPMDVGMIDWGAEVAGIARRHGVAGRVHFVDGGDLDALIGKARGVLTSNSTVGLTALRAGCPVKTFGVAIYDLPGLTHQGELSRFWSDPEPVDKALAGDLVRALAGTIQLRGSFYGRRESEGAIAEIVERVLERRVNEPSAFMAPPPRLERAKALGILS